MTRHELTVASFFSGVGLLDLGLEWAGWRTVSVSEIDPYASARLAERFPGVPNLGDLHGITDVPDATLWAGGFPCQPVSIAGRGRAQDDERWLWPVWCRLIRQLRPRLLLLENVSNLLAVNDGGAFGEVLGDLAACGYDAEWDCLPAAAVGAPHRRDRVWIVASRPELGRDVADPHDGGPRHEVRAGWDAVGDGGSDVAHADGAGQSGVRIVLSTYLHPPYGDDSHRRGGSLPDAGGQRGLVPPRWEHPAVQQPRGLGTPRSLAEFRREAGRSWATEPELGRVAHGVPNRVDRLRCLGNGVVPQVAEYIGMRLAAYLEEAA